MTPGFYALTSAWLFLLTVPVVVFYFLKLKRPRLEVPSLALWGRVMEDTRVNSPFQRFKRNLLLLLQLLLLCLLVLAAMQPYIGAIEKRKDRLPVLIDCSARASSWPASCRTRSCVSSPSAGGRGGSPDSRTTVACCGTRSTKSRSRTCRAILRRRFA
jgi:hypothetical protein